MKIIVNETDTSDNKLKLEYLENYAFPTLNLFFDT